jgi:hypothetical protein
MFGGYLHPDNNLQSARLLNFDGDNGRSDPLRPGRCRRNAGDIYSRKSQPLVRSGVRVFLLAGVRIRFPSGSMAVWADRGDLGRCCFATLVDDPACADLMGDVCLVYSLQTGLDREARMMTFMKTAKNAYGNLMREQGRSRDGKLSSGNYPDQEGVAAACRLDDSRPPGGIPLMGRLENRRTSWRLSPGEAVVFIVGRTTNWHRRSAARAVGPRRNTVGRR